MATIPGVTTAIGHHQMRIVWAAVTETDTFGAVQCGGRFTDRTVVVSGTFDSATITVKGSLDGTNYITLTIPAGDAAFTALGGGVLQEVTTYLQPTHSGGGATQSVTVTVLLTAGR